MHVCSVLERVLAPALALVACALVARGEELHARCPPDAGERCEETYFIDDFFIDGQINTLECKNDNWCIIMCNNISLDNGVWPRCPQLVSCDNVWIEDCPPPAGASYWDALRVLNITALSGSRIVLPRNFISRLSALALRDSPAFLSLVLEERDGVEELPPGVLANTNLTGLELERLRTYDIPLGLDTLVLDDSSAEGLSPMVLAVKSLQIEDFNLKSLMLLAHALSYMYLNTPALENLRILNGDSKVVFVPFASNMQKLRLLSLVETRGTQLLPRKFLRGASALQMLEIIGSNITTVPEDLFSYSPKLKFVDLSRNHLRTLPEYLFLQPNVVDTLLLANNNLTAESLTALAPLTWLKKLDLFENPLRDLCIRGSKSLLFPLQQLRSLNLARTSQIHLCDDWLNDMRALAELDLRDNYIKNFPCADLRLSRAAHVTARINLSGNLITRAICDRSEFMSITSYPVEAKGVTFVMTSVPACKCSMLWFALVVRDLHITIESPRKLDYCNESYIRTLNCVDALKIALEGDNVIEYEDTIGPSPNTA